MSEWPLYIAAGLGYIEVVKMLYEVFICQWMCVTVIISAKMKGMCKFLHFILYSMVVMLYDIIDSICPHLYIKQQEEDTKKSSS